MGKRGPPGLHFTAAGDIRTRGLHGETCVFKLTTPAAFDRAVAWLANIGLNENGDRLAVVGDPPAHSAIVSPCAPLTTGGENDIVVGSDGPDAEALGATEGPAIIDCPDADVAGTCPVVDGPSGESFAPVPPSSSPSGLSCVDDMQVDAHAADVCNIANAIDVGTRLIGADGASGPAPDDMLSQRIESLDDVMGVSSAEMDVSSSQQVCVSGDHACAPIEGDPECASGAPSPLEVGIQPECDDSPPPEPNESHASFSSSSAGSTQHPRTDVPDRGSEHVGPPEPEVDEVMPEFDHLSFAISERADVVDRLGQYWGFAEWMAYGWSSKTKVVMFFGASAVDLFATFCSPEMRRPIGLRKSFVSYSNPHPSFKYSM